MIDITFIPNIAGIINKLKQIEVAFIQGPDLEQEVKRIHDNIEGIVKNNLLSISKADPEATTSHHVLDVAVANNITSHVIKTFRGTIEGGTGDIMYMDKTDPLNSLRDGEYKLWRILEEGVSDTHYITAKSPDVPMVFYWKRRQVLFVGKGEKYIMQDDDGMKTMFGFPPYNVPIKHPPFEGRKYWEISQYEAGTLFQTEGMRALQRVARRLFR